MKQKLKFMKTEKIISNKAKCKKCGTLIESTHQHDFVTCNCGAISVDGGKAYLRRCGNLEDFEDLSEIVEQTNEQ